MSILYHLVVSRQKCPTLTLNCLSSIKLPSQAHLLCLKIAAKDEADRVQTFSFTGSGLHRLFLFGSLFVY